MLMMCLARVGPIGALDGDGDDDGDDDFDDDDYGDGDRDGTAHPLRIHTGARHFVSGFFARGPNMGSECVDAVPPHMFGNRETQKFGFGCKFVFANFVRMCKSLAPLALLRDLDTMRVEHLLCQKGGLLCYRIQPRL